MKWPDAIVEAADSSGAGLADLTLSGPSDQTALMNLAQQIYNARGGGCIGMRPGSYHADGLLNWTYPVDLIALSRGAGYFAYLGAGYNDALNSVVWLLKAHSNCDVMHIDPAYYANDLKIEGINFEGGSTQDSPCNGVVLPQNNAVYSQITLRNVRVTILNTQVAHAFVVKPTAIKLQRLLMENCEAEDYLLGDGLRLDASVKPIEDVRISNFRGRSGRRGAYLTGDIRALQWIGGDLYGHNRESIYAGNIPGHGNNVIAHVREVGAGAEVADTYSHVYLENVKSLLIDNVGNALGGNGNEKYGYYLKGCSLCEIRSPKVYLAQRGGIFLEGSSHNKILGGTLRMTCQKANDTYSVISMTGGSTRNIVSGVLCYEDTGNKAKYCVSEDSASDDFNEVIGNQLIGAVTAPIKQKGPASDFGHNR